MIRNMMQKSHSGSVIAHFMVLAMMFAAGGCAHNDKPMIEGAYIPDDEVAYRRPESRLFRKCHVQEDIVAQDMTEVPYENVSEGADTPYDIQPEPPQQEPSVSPEPVVQKPSARPASSDSAVSIKYTVRKGDNLWKISKLYGVSEKKIAEANGMDSKDALQYGQVLHIPADHAPEIKSEPMKPKAVSGAAKSEYIVKQGDVLSVIAQHHGIKTKDLAAANNLSVDKKIFPGQKLIIPAKTEVSNIKKAPEKAVSAKTVKPAEPVKTAEPAKTTKPAAAAKSAEPAKPVKPAATAKPAEPAKPVKPAAAAKAEEKAPKAAVPVKSSAGNEIDDLMTNADSPAASAPAASSEDLNLDDQISVRLERAMTISEIEDSYGRPAEAIKKLNPKLSPDAKIPSGTSVILPL